MNQRSPANGISKPKGIYMKTKNQTAVAAESSAVYETENDLPRASRAEVIGLVNQRLADIIDLQAHLIQAHWNVKGPHFIGLHELFDKIAEELESYTDGIAELAVELGGTAQGTIQVVGKQS